MEHKGIGTQKEQGFPKEDYVGKRLGEKGGDGADFGKTKNPGCQSQKEEATKSVSKHKRVIVQRGGKRFAFHPVTRRERRKACRPQKKSRQPMPFS